MKTYWKIIDAIMWVLEILAMLFLVSMVLIVFYAVIMRYFMLAEPGWTDEVILLLMIWFSFIGMAMGLRAKAHIAIEIFLRMLPKKLAWLIELLDYVLILILSGVLCYYSIGLIQSTMKNVLPATGMSTSVRFAVLPLVGAIMALILIGQIIEHFTVANTEGSGEGEF